VGGWVREEVYLGRKPDIAGPLYKLAWQVVASQQFMK
jgi:hypothetical protein